MNRFGIAAVAAVAAIGFSAGLYAQSSMPPSSSAAADKVFLTNAAESNEAEIAQSQIALKKSKNPDVKAYAQQMIDDHMKLMSTMKPINDMMGVQPPPLTPTHKTEEQRLEAMSGSKFDMEYVKSMVIDHHKTLGLLKNEDQTTANSQIKASVEQAIPIVQDHTDKADAMAQKMNIPVPAMGQ